jgi:hypothetical protein
MDSSEAIIARKRIKMRLSLSSYTHPTINFEDFPPFAVTEGHIDALANLLDASYRNTIDYDGESLEDCILETSEVMDNKYGPVLPASYIMFDGSLKTAIGAVLVTLWEAEPLIAF